MKINIQTVKAFAVALCVGAVLLVCACGSSSDSANTNATSNTSNANTTTTANTSPSKETRTTASAGDRIGVPECDEYLEKYESCLNGKVPEAARATLKASFETTRKAWKDAASTPQGKAGLAQACKSARDAAKQSMGAYGCNW